MAYTFTRLLPMTIGFGLWMGLSDGSVTDPAHVLLPISIGAGGLGLAAVRRYWVIRSTSRSRRDSSLFA